MQKSWLKCLVWAALFGILLATPALAGTAQYTYDSLNRLTQVQFDDGTTIRYAYDAAGNRLSRQVTPSAPAQTQPPASGQSSGSTATIPLIQNSQTPTRSVP